MYESKHPEKSAVSIYQVINRMAHFQGELIGIDVLFEISRVGVSPAASQKNGQSNQKRNLVNGHRPTQKNTDN